MELSQKYCNLRDRISSLNNEVETNIDCLNHGGCIHYARFLGYKLKRLGIDCEAFLIHDEEDYTFSKIKAFGCLHVLLYIPELGFVDSTGIHKGIPEMYQNEVIWEKNYAISTLKHFNRAYWNPTYNTSQNKLLKKLINKHINDLL